MTKIIPALIEDYYYTDDPLSKGLWILGFWYIGADWSFSPPLGFESRGTSVPVLVNFVEL